MAFPKNHCKYCGGFEFVEQRDSKGKFVEMYCTICDKKSEYHTNKMKKLLK